jgi:AraC family transcriptional regulator
VLKQIQRVVAYAARHLDEDVSLDALAALGKLSKFHLQRRFLAASGETPKQFTLRLRLARAAAMLLVTRDSVLDIALASGFQSHEAFSRAFRRVFGIAPSAYRARGFAGRNSVSAASKHAELVNQIAPCIRLFHDAGRVRGENRMAYSISKKEIAEEPVLVVRRRIKPSEVAATLAAALGQVFQYAQQNGIALAGQPFTRYIEWGPGIWTIEAGLPVTAKVATTSSESDVRADVLPGGLVATATHTGPYDKLNEAHAAVQQWVEAQGLRSAGAPWEVYVTDPADYPDPKDWKTDVFWPLQVSK